MSILTRDQNGNATDIFTAGPAQVFTVTNSSVASNAFGINTTHVLVTCSLGHGHIAFGTNPTASITTSTMIPNNESLYFAVKPGDKMAVIKDSDIAASTICVTELV
jgi:hypothetical protein